MGVPQNVFIIVLAFTNFDIPKSDTLAKVISELLANNIFSGYKLIIRQIIKLIFINSLDYIF